jgi:hypothetical protein
MIRLCAHDGISTFPAQTIPLNSTLTTALTFTYPGLKRDGGPRLSDLKARGPSRPLASQRVPSSGHFMRYFTSLRNRVRLHRSNQFRKIVCRDLSDVEVVLVLCGFVQSLFFSFTRWAVLYKLQD